jgi:hypothetical protein
MPSKALSRSRTSLLKLKRGNFDGQIMTNQYLMEEMGGQIFISYRRDDSAASAGRIYDRLNDHFASSEIFMDVDTLAPGIDFVEAIEESVSSCDALIAVIGRQWLVLADEEGNRRMDNPDDFVRIEIRTALERGVRVIPVLVDGASMPRARDLPDDLKLLVRRNALEVRHTSFNADCGRLIAALEQVLGLAKGEQPGAHNGFGRVGRTKRIAEEQAEAMPSHVRSGVATPASTPGDALVNATKAKPFENSMGMRFVPVPICKGNGSQEVTRAVLMSQWETRVKDYDAFCEATSRSREKPRFAQTPDEPIVNVSWKDAKAFCEWLSKKEGQTYRLPTDREWSCAVGIGDREDPNKTPEEMDEQIANVYPWGSQWPPPDNAGNYFGEECEGHGKLALKEVGYDIHDLSVLRGFNDGKVFTAAVGSYRPNDLGLYDLGGNVWEWCEDKYNAISGWRALRGGAWCNTQRDLLLSSYRYDGDPDIRYDSVGFRCVVESQS